MSSDGDRACLGNPETPGPCRTSYPGVATEDAREGGRLTAEAWEARSLSLPEASESRPITEVESLQAVTGGIVRAGAEPTDVKSSPSLELCLLVQVGNRPSLPSPSVESLSKSMVPEVVSFGQHVIQETELIAEGVEPVSIGKKHVGNAHGMMLRGVGVFVAQRS